MSTINLFIDTKMGQGTSIIVGSGTLTMGVATMFEVAPKIIGALSALGGLALSCIMIYIAISNLKTNRERRRTEKRKLDLEVEVLELQKEALADNDSKEE